VTGPYAAALRIMSGETANLPFPYLPEKQRASRSAVGTFSRSTLRGTAEALRKPTKGQWRN
jgi:hypothetical protein